MSVIKLLQLSIAFIIFAIGFLIGFGRDKESRGKEEEHRFDSSSLLYNPGGKLGGRIFSDRYSVADNQEWFLSSQTQKSLEPFYNVLNHKTFRTIDDIIVTQKYVKSPIMRHILHVGQLKLLLSEIQFLTDVVSDDERILCVYAGSAPSNKMPLLSEMFPEVRFLLCDPNEHVLMGDYEGKLLYFKKAPGGKFNPDKPLYTFPGAEGSFDIKKYIDVGERARYNVDMDEMIQVINSQMGGELRFFIYEDLFSNELAKAVSKFSGRLLFISDIRTNSGETDFESEPEDIDVLWNNAMQYNWLRYMSEGREINFMLKFRQLYMNEELGDVPKGMMDDFELAKTTIGGIQGIDFLKFPKGKMEYLDGEVRLQAYAGVASSECRLVSSKMTRKLYDNHDYEDKMFNFNKFVRMFCFHANHKYFDKDIGVDACSDCDLMIDILRNYFVKFNKLDKDSDEIVRLVKNHIKRILTVIDRTLTGLTLHGSFVRPYKSIEEVINEQKMYMIFSSMCVYKNVFDKLTFGKK